MNNSKTSDTAYSYLIFSITLLIVFIVISILIKNNKNENLKSKSSKKDIESLTADTFLPKGYVLIPIEFSNYTSISSIISNFAILDLFAPDSSGKMQLIATQVKVLRAPLNPSVFAALISEDRVKTFMEHQASFYAVIHNSKMPTTNKKSQNIEITNFKKPSIQTTNLQIQYQ